MMPVLVDTGILYALADADDAWHARARTWLAAVSGLLIVPITVLPEVAYLLQTRLGASAELAFVQSVTDAELDLEEIYASDLKRCCDLMRKYPAIGFVDASIVAVAERLKIDAVATTDRRHFSSVKPKHVKMLELVP